VFGIGWTEFIVIALVLLIFVGPRQLPVVLRKAGQIIGDLKGASRDLKTQLDNEIRDIEDDLRKAAPEELIDDITAVRQFKSRTPRKAVAYRASEAVNKEIRSLKRSIEKDGLQETIEKKPRTRAAGDETEGVKEILSTKKESKKESAPQQNEKSTQSQTAGFRDRKPR
jgi:Tat protein translocase TatB subunit